MPTHLSNSRIMFSSSTERRRLPLLVVAWCLIVTTATAATAEVARTSAASSSSSGSCGSTTTQRQQQPPSSWGSSSLSSPCRQQRLFVQPQPAFFSRPTFGLALHEIRGGSFDPDGRGGSKKAEDDEDEELFDDEDEEEEWFDTVPSLRDEDDEEELEFAEEAWEDEDEEEVDFLDAVDEAEEEAEIELATQVTGDDDDFTGEYNTLQRQKGGEPQQKTTLAAKVNQAFASEEILDNPVFDDNDSSTYVDRMDLADAYDEEVGLDTTDTGTTTDAGSTTNIAPTTTATTAAEALSAAPSAAPPITSSIDESTKKILTKDLKYRKKEVEAMRPDIASIVAAKKLHRPYEGMPANWYREGTKKASSSSSKSNTVMKILPKIVVPLVIGAAAIVKGPDLLSAIQSSRTSSSDEEPSFTLPLEDAFDSEDNEEEDSSPGSLLSSSTSNEPSTSSTSVLPVNEHTTTLGEPHPHSIKPKSSSSPDADELDVTWLDKLITAVEKKIKAFVRWEI